MENEYYLAILLPEHVSLLLRRGKTLAFQQTGDESFYKTPSCIIVGKTKLKDPPRYRFQLDLIPNNEIILKNNISYITFKDDNELNNIQEKYCEEKNTIGIPLSLIGNTGKFSLPHFSVSKMAIIVKNDFGFTIKR